MNSLLGQSLILVALGAAAFGSAAGWVGGKRPSQGLLKILRLSVYLFSAAMILGNLVMIGALVGHDFSVKYVAQVGSRATPTYIAIVSLWSALEGSILFWGAILGVNALAFALVLRDRFATHMPYALATILTVGTFFALLLAGPADPFGAVWPVPPDGPGPNPLLQNHALMIVHPPTLYLGYVGLTLPFAVAVSALLRAELTEGWMRVMRRTMLLAWAFLSVGIVMGAWWAYEVLGWGGYWAWDPVENASFFPWLAATAYLHSTVVLERKRMLKAWTLALVVLAFVLTILGTFMTRSGVFNSVHSFTKSAIGPLFLVFLATITLLSLFLLAARTHLLEPEGRIGKIVSREGSFVAFTLLLLVLTFTVVLGTIFPLVTEAVRGVKVSVGEPYFNRMAVPVGLAVVFLMGICPMLPWGGADKRVWRELAIPGAVGLATVLTLYLLGIHELMALVTFGLCAVAAVAVVRELVSPFASRLAMGRGSVASAVVTTLTGQQRKVGGHVVHLAVIVIVAGICGSQLYKRTADLSLAPGDSAELGPYQLTFQQTVRRDEPHRMAVVAKVEVREHGQLVGVMEPTLNFYPTQREPIGSPAVWTLKQRDLYLSLMSVEPDGSRVSLKAFVVPLVSWLWWSLPVLLLGSVIALLPRRRVRAATAPVEGVPAR